MMSSNGGLSISNLKPGQILDEKRLGSELSIGRTPIREALLMLNTEGWIISLPNKSAYVKEITLKDVKDLVESLSAIEKLTARLAAQRITPEALREIKKVEAKIARAINRKDYWKLESHNQTFHQLIAKASNNQYLSSIHESLRRKGERFLTCRLAEIWETHYPLMITLKN